MRIAHNSSQSPSPKDAWAFTRWNEKLPSSQTAPIEDNKGRDRIFTRVRLVGVPPLVICGLLVFINFRPITEAAQARQIDSDIAINPSQEKSVPRPSAAANAMEQSRIGDGVDRRKLTFFGIHSGMSRKDATSAIAQLGFALIPDNVQMGERACWTVRSHVEGCRAWDEDKETGMDLTFFDDKLAGYSFYVRQICVPPSCPPINKKLEQLIKSLTLAASQHLGPRRDLSNDNELYYSWCGGELRTPHGLMCGEEVAVRHRLHNQYDTEVSLSYVDNRLVYSPTVKKPHAD